MLHRACKCAGDTRAEVRRSRVRCALSAQNEGESKHRGAAGSSMAQAVQNNCVLFLLKTTWLPVVNMLRMQHDKASRAEKTPMRWSGSQLFVVNEMPVFPNSRRLKRRRFPSEQHTAAAAINPLAAGHPLVLGKLLRRAQEAPVPPPLSSLPSSPGVCCQTQSWLGYPQSIVRMYTYISEF